MALTDDEKHLVFEVFDIPDATDVTYVDGQFGTGFYRPSGAVLVTRDEILTRIDALTTAQTTRLSDLLAQWSKVSTQTTRIRPNAANEGVDVNPARTRQLIRERIRMILPIFRPNDLEPGGIALG